MEVSDSIVVNQFPSANLHRVFRSQACKLVSFPAETKTSAIVDKFKELTSRDDVGILLINQNVRRLMRNTSLRLFFLRDTWRRFFSNAFVFHACYQVAEEIREVLNLYDQMYPTILEIPSKDHPYSAEKDYIMKRVMHMLGK